MLYLISGPSGCGKSTIAHEVFGRSREIVSVTTRAPRTGEIDGVDYYFIDRDEYDRLRRYNSLVEHAEYGGNGYGITYRELTTKTAAGDAFAIVELHGMQQLRRLAPDAVTVFIWTPQDAAMRNLVHRGENMEFIHRRMETYAAEMENRSLYDYVVKNVPDRMDIAVSILDVIVDAGRDDG